MLGKGSCDHPFDAACETLLNSRSNWDLVIGLQAASSTLNFQDVVTTAQLANTAASLTLIYSHNNNTPVGRVLWGCICRLPSAVAPSVTSRKSNHQWAWESPVYHPSLISDIHLTFDRLWAIVLGSIKHGHKWAQYSYTHHLISMVTLMTPSIPNREQSQHTLDSHSCNLLLVDI